MKSNCRLLVRTILCLLALCAVASSQSNLGSIVGAILDPSGAPVADAIIHVTNSKTNDFHEYKTGASGEYSITHLLSGLYRVEADIPGFKHFVHDNIIVSAGETVRADIHLEVGSSRQSVDVSGSGTPQIETDSASLAEQRNTEQYRTFPVIQNHEPYTLLATMSNFQIAQSQSYSSTYKFSIAGALTGQSEFQMDGISAPNNNLPELSASQTMEGTSEVRLQAVNNNAEYGEPGIYQMVSRSGTNEIHGSAYYYHDNSALAARDFFDTVKPRSIRHEYGGSISGSVVIPHIYNGHDRTFFMLAYDGGYSPAMGTRVDNVPTPAFRGGDFSSLLPKTKLINPFTQQPFAGNVIPASLMSPVALAFQNLFYPAPNTGAIDNLKNNLTTVYPASGKENIGDIRVDQKIRDNNDFYIRVGARQFPATRLKTLPTIGYPSILRTFRTLILVDTHTFNPHLVNEFRFGQITTDNKYIDGGQRGLNVIKETGLQGLNNLPDDWGMPVISISGFSSLTHNGNNRYFYHDRNRQFTDSLTSIVGRHTLKFGIDVRHQYPDVQNVPLGLYGQFSFNGVFTGNPYADFLLGLSQTSTTVPQQPTVQKYQTDWFVFGQDDFHVSSRLTANVGLRYEYQQPLTESGGLLYNFDPATGSIVVPTAKRSAVNLLFNQSVPIVTAQSVGYPENGFRRGDASNFAPRVGFALRLNDHNDFVIRGGYGIYVVNVGNSLLSSQEGGPFSQVAATYVNQLDTLTHQPLFQFPDPFPPTTLGPSTAPPALNALNPNLQNPYVQQWNLTLEKEMAKIGFRASYIGTKGTGLLYSRNINIPAPSTLAFAQSRRPNPSYGNISYLDNGGNSIYHGLQLESSRRFASGVTFNLSWTFSNNISDVQDTGGGVFGSTIQNPNCRSCERGRVPYSATHRVVGNFIWDLPFGRDRRYLNQMPRIADEFLGGWQLTGLGTYQTGLWFSPLFSGQDTTGSGISGGRPNCIANGNLPGSQQSVQQWFNPNAFSIPAPGTYGNCGVDILEGPKLAVFHLGLGKEFRVGERMRISLQASAQNVFNHPNFGLPNPTYNVSQGGSISSTLTSLVNAGEASNQARQIQLRGRITF
jgi:hypothetical protein